MKPASSTISDLMTGAFDTHIHAAPDIVDRVGDFLAVAQSAETARMAGLVFKDLSGDTVDRAYAINQLGLELKAFGGVVLDLPVGGVNPRAVQRTLSKGGRVVWMPVAHSRNTLDRYRTGSLRLLIPPDVNEEEALSVLTKDGELTAEARGVVDIVASHDAVLASGHLSVEETKALFSYAVKAGVRRLLVTHPCGLSIGATADDQRELVELGAMVEHCYAQTTPGLDDLPLESIIDAINAVGSEHCVLATDLGQAFNPPHVEGLRLFVEALLASGVAAVQLRAMLQKNPARLFHWAA